MNDFFVSGGVRHERTEGNDSLLDDSIKDGSFFFISRTSITVLATLERTARLKSLGSPRNSPMCALLRPGVLRRKSATSAGESSTMPCSTLNRIPFFALILKVRIALSSFAISAAFFR